MLYINNQEITIQKLLNITPDEHGWRQIHGFCVKLGDNVELGSNTSSTKLNKQFIASFPEESIFWKWVSADRTSFLYSHKKIVYTKGAIIEEKNGVASDKQCDVGLHVFRPPYRPEWVGLAKPNHNLICLRVKVKRKDILFGGLPTMDAKIRVRKLEVLD